MKRRIQVCTCFLFCGFLATFLVLNVLSPDKQFSENENRNLKQYPTFTVKSLLNNTYISNVEKAMNDQFVFRDQWIQIKAASKIATGSIENNGVYFGKNEYLIQMFSSYNKKDIELSIKQMNQFIDQVEVPVQVMVVPTASAMNQNDLPQFALNVDQSTILAQLETQLHGNWIDVFTALQGHQDIYYKTDHHWNELGAYIAYQEYCAQNGIKAEKFTFEVVSNEFKGTMVSKSGVFWHRPESIVKMIPEHIIDSYVQFEDENEMNQLFDAQKLEVKDKYAYYLGGNHSLVTIQNKGVVSDQGKILVIKDSYAHIFVPYLASHYSEIILVDLRYYHLPLTELIKSEEIDQILFLYNLENFVIEKNFAFLK